MPRALASSDPAFGILFDGLPGAYSLAAHVLASAHDNTYVYISISIGIRMLFNFHFIHYISVLGILHLVLARTTIL